MQPEEICEVWKSSMTEVSGVPEKIRWFVILVNSDKYLIENPLWITGFKPWEFLKLKIVGRKDYLYVNSRRIKEIILKGGEMT